MYFHFKHSDRFLGIELAKFVTIIFVQIFFTLNWAITSINISDFSNPWTKILFNFPIISFTGFALLLVPPMSGFAFRKYIEIRNNKIIAQPKNGLIFIFVTLLTASVAKNFISFSSSTIFSWDIFLLILFSYLLIYFLCRLNVYLLTLLLLLSFLESFFQKTSIPIITSGTWPILPWAGIISIGFILGHQYLATKNLVRFKIIILIIALILFFTCGPLLKDHLSLSYMQYLQTNYFDPNLALLLFYVSIYLLSTLLMATITSLINIKRKGLIDCYSRGILPIMIISPILGKLLFSLISNLPTPMWINTLIHIISMLLISWLIGHLTIKFIHEKSYHLKIRRMK